MKFNKLKKSSWVQCGIGKERNCCRQQAMITSVKEQLGKYFGAIQVNMLKSSLLFCVMFVTFMNGMAVLSVTNVNVVHTWGQRLDLPWLSGLAHFKENYNWLLDDLKKSHLPPDCIGVISQWMFHKESTFCTVVWWQEQCSQLWITVPMSFMTTVLGYMLGILLLKISICVEQIFFFFFEEFSIINWNRNILYMYVCVYTGAPTCPQHTQCNLSITKFWGWWNYH